MISSSQNIVSRSIDNNTKAALNTMAVKDFTETLSCDREASIFIFIHCVLVSSSHVFLSSDDMQTMYRESFK